MIRWSVLLICIFIAGCNDARSVPSDGWSGHHHTVGATLSGLGYWLTVIGGAVSAAGFLALAASFFPWTSFLAIFRDAIIEAIAIGFASVLVGSAFIWVGAHTWLLAVVIALVGAGLAWRYRNRLSRIFRSTFKIKSKE